MVSQGAAVSTSAEPISNSSILLQKIALAQPRLDAASQRFWTHTNLSELLPHFFLDLHAIVRGGLLTMQIAQERAETLSSRDRLASMLSTYYKKHIEEERDHDNWLLDDMKASGIDPKRTLARLTPGHVATLLGAQTFWILQQHPVAFLGYIAVIEGNPPTYAHLESVREATGFPDEAFRCLREHADADQEHGAELWSLIDSLPLSALHHQLLALSAFETIEGVSRVFDQLCYDKGLQPCCDKGSSRKS